MGLYFFIRQSARTLWGTDYLMGMDDVEWFSNSQS